jgi:hypothetical protein
MSSKIFVVTFRARSAVKKGLKRLCRSSVPSLKGLRLAPLTVPGTDVPGFPIPPLRGWSRGSSTSLRTRGCNTDSKPLVHVARNGAAEAAPLQLLMKGPLNKSLHTRLTNLFILPLSWFRAGHSSPPECLQTLCHLRSAPSAVWLFSSAPLRLFRCSVRHCRRS